MSSSVAGAQQGEAELRDLRVLVVEDSWHVAHALKTLLEELGVSVAGPAATLDEAERLLAARTPDVAIVDINLKGEMAYGLIDHLNDIGARVVVISGYAVPQVRLHELMYGPVDLVSKRLLSRSATLQMYRGIYRAQRVSERL